MESFRKRINWKINNLTSRISYLREGISREFFYYSSNELSDWQSLAVVFPFLHSRLSGKEALSLIQSKIGRVERALDIGAGTNPLKPFIVARGVSEVIAVDPGYRYYDNREVYIDKLGIIGSRWEKAEMIHLLKLVFKGLNFPRMEGKEEYIITGVRGGRARRIRLVPEDASVWIKNWDQSVPLIIVWRVFPPAETWGYILQALDEGGVLITTGYGLSFQNQRERRDYSYISWGVDIDDTSLPRNGNTKIIGLEPLLTGSSLITDDNIYFYRKVRPLRPEEVRDALISNS